MTQSGEDFRDRGEITNVSDLGLTLDFLRSLKSRQKRLAPGFLAFLHGIESDLAGRPEEGKPISDPEIGPGAEEFAAFHDSLDERQRRLMEEIDLRGLLVPGRSEHEN